MVQSLVIVGKKIIPQKSTSITTVQDKDRSVGLQYQKYNSVDGTQPCKIIVTMFSTVRPRRILPRPSYGYMGKFSLLYKNFFKDISVHSKELQKKL